MHFFYNLTIYFYSAIIRFAARFRTKAKLWKEGREGLLEKIALTLDQEDEHVWFHCASLGEFEQGRPVMEKFRKENPKIKIVLTFYSPSGYEMRKNYPGADYVFYMPEDTPQKARKFVEYLQPRLAVFVKYEYWFNHLIALQEQKIPVVYISAIFRPGQLFFKWWGGWFRKHLKNITYFFVQDKASQSLLYSFGIRNVVVSGDTRFDRVFEIRNKPSTYKKVEKFIQGDLIFMAGSTWPKDEKILATLVAKNYQGIKYVIVPHEIEPGHIQNLMQLMGDNVVKYSEYDEEKFMNAKVLIIDEMGMLSSLYQYASVAYIGGGFGAGIHNILEAATYGMPVVFGPRYQKFAEARELVEHGGAFPVSSESELVHITWSLLSNYKNLNASSRIAKEYVDMKKGATQTILVFLNAMVNPGSYRPQAPDLINMN